MLRARQIIKFFKGCGRCMSTVVADKSANLQEQEKFEQKSCRVAVLGALTTTGKALALLLKQNPLISQIFLFDGECTTGLAADLNHLDTHSVAVGFDKKEIHCAVRNADIIIMLGLESITADSSFAQKIKVEGKRLIEYATSAVLHAPKAIFVDCVIPLSVTLPIVSQVYRLNHWYHPGKVLGSVSQQQMRLNSVLALHQDLDPAVVHVPLLGGPEDDILLPLFSRASPMQVPLPEAHIMVNRFRQVETSTPKSAGEVKYEYAPHGNAYAINRLVSTIAMGLMGDGNAISTAFVRTNCVGACKHLVSTVKFGQHGIVHNYGIPKLTHFELKLFEKIVLELNKREDLANGFLEKFSADDQLTKTQVAASDPLYFPAAVDFYPPDEGIIVDT